MPSADNPSRYDFDVAVKRYDQWYETTEGAMYDHLEKKAVSRYIRQNTRGIKLLEVGCGTGHWSRFLHLPYGVFIAGQVKL